MTLPGTYCQDVETFEIFKLSTRLPRREGTKFDALIIQQFAISKKKRVGKFALMSIQTKPGNYSNESASEVQSRWKIKVSPGRGNNWASTMRLI